MRGKSWRIRVTLENTVMHAPARVYICRYRTHRPKREFHLELVRRLAESDLAQSGIFSVIQYWLVSWGLMLGYTSSVF